MFRRLLKITLSDYIKFIEDLGKARKVDVVVIKKKLAECGPPGVTSAAVSCHLRFELPPFSICKYMSLGAVVACEVCNTL